LGSKLGIDSSGELDVAAAKMQAMMEGAAIVRRELAGQ
jgi:hypothetical protein